jgi:hypothetical protein
MEEEEGAGELGRYHVEGSTALPDAVCVEHMEDSVEDPRVCKEKSTVLKGMGCPSLLDPWPVPAERSGGLQRAQQYQGLLEFFTH